MKKFKELMATIGKAVDKGIVSPKERNKRKHREKVADPTWADPWTSSGTHKIHGHPGAKNPDWFAKKNKGGFLQKGFKDK